jgi:hypothetical protein
VTKQVPLAFFSYSRKDSDFALRLAEDLRAAGANVWLDQLDIELGQRWAREVETALISCPLVLVILSCSSVESPNVQNEITFALEEKKVIIPILYGECRILLELRGLQFADFRTDYDRGFRTLLKTLSTKQHIGSGSASSSGHIKKKADAGRQSELERRKRANDNVAKMKEQWQKKRDKEAAARQAELELVREKEAVARQAELQRRKRANDNVAKMKEQWQKKRDKEAAARQPDLERRQRANNNVARMKEQWRRKREREAAKTAQAVPQLRGLNAGSAK